MESVWSVSNLSTESIGSRRQLVANCVHTADADATKLDSFVASACVLGFSGSIVCRISEVTLHWARLILGWVTVSERITHLDM